MNLKTGLIKRILNETHLSGETELNQVFDLFQRTILHGESNSALLIGPRGAGKTTLVKTALAKLEETKVFDNDALLVQLNGLIHTDDKLALKSATNQMNLDNAVDGKVFGSFAENLAFLLACLRSGERTSTKSVIFVLEEFDLFCSHHNQTLLYNLFDVSQSQQAPICILGVTCRLDVIELLEKRVKSRFSHRQIFLFPDNDLNKTLSRIENLLTVKDAKNKASKWNSSLKALLKDKKFCNIVQRIIDLDLNQRTLKLFLVKALHELGDNILTVEPFQKQLDQLELDDLVLLLQDLSVLELSLIIAMKHHNEIYDNQPMNFEMILTRYIKFANANANIQSMPRAVIMKAFEHIESLELISMLNITGPKVQKEYQFFKLLVTSDQITEAVNKCIGLPTEVVQWANSSII